MAADYTQPAQQTELGQSARGFVPGQVSPDRGLLLRSSLVAQPKDTARVLKNLRYNGIAWTTEKVGYTRHRATTFNSGGAFKEFAVHYTSDGVAHFIQQVGTKVQTYDALGDPNIVVESTIYTAGSETYPCMRSFSYDKFLYVNGVDNPRVWNGTGAMTAMAGWPVGPVGSHTFNTPSLVEVFNNRACYAGFPGEPYALVLSYFNAPDNFDLVGIGTLDPSRAGIYNVPSIFGPIVTLKSFKLSTSTNLEVLLVGCQNGFLFLQGTTANDFQLIAAEFGRFGFVSNRCWMKLDDVALALCTDGVRPFAGNTNFSSMLNAALTYPIHPLITAMATDPVQRQQAFVINNPNELECEWHFPGGADSHNLQVIYMSYADMSQGLVRFAQKSYPSESTDPESWHAASCAISFGGRIFKGGYNGYLQDAWSGNLFFNAGIPFQYSSPLFDAPTPAQEGSARGFYILCEGPSQRFTANAYYWPGQNPQAMGAVSGASAIMRVKSATSKLFTTNMAGSIILGSWVLGQGAFGGSGRQLFEFFPQGAGRGWELELSGDTAAGGDFSLVGIFSTLIGGGTRQ